jgi:hypothetical protein
MRVDLSKIFGKFAGREVPMNEKQEEYRVGRLTRTRIIATPAEEKPAVGEEMKAEAEKHGLKFRLLWPGRGYTDDYVRTRVNAHVEKGKDGKYRISNKFDIG